MKPTPASPTTPADAEKVKHLKTTLHRLVKDGHPLETILRVKALMALLQRAGSPDGGRLL